MEVTGSLFDHKMPTLIDLIGLFTSADYNRLSIDLKLISESQPIPSPTFHDIYIYIYIYIYMFVSHMCMCCIQLRRYIVSFWGARSINGHGA